MVALALTYVFPSVVGPVRPESWLSQFAALRQQTGTSSCIFYVGPVPTAVPLKGPDSWEEPWDESREKKLESMAHPDHMEEQPQTSRGPEGSHHEGFFRCWGYVGGQVNLEALVG